MLFRLFTEHPRSVDETYLQHLGAAFGFSWRLFAAALACLVHAIFPFLFVKTGSNMIVLLHDRMVTNRNRSLPRQTEEAGGEQDVSMARLHRTARLS